MFRNAACPECGARYESDDDSCAIRFDTLLALDHSRREPWGSRHGQAFATFALQHPSVYPTSLDAAWSALYRIHCLREQAARVFSHLGRNTPIGEIPPRPTKPVALPAVTIVDLTDFDASVYPDKLDAWSRATLVAWGAPVAQTTT